MLQAWPKILPYQMDLVHNKCFIYFRMHFFIMHIIDSDNTHF